MRMKECERNAREDGEVKREKGRLMEAKSSIGLVSGERLKGAEGAFIFSVFVILENLR